MKKHQQKNVFFLKTILLAVTCIVCCSMGTGGTEVSTPLEPAYSELDEDADIVHGILRDNGKTFKIKNLSFSGKTELEVPHENDDSYTTIDLGKIATLTIINQNHASKRYPNKDYSLVKITTHKEGGVIEDVLVPLKLSIVGIDKKTDLGKAWFISNITSISFEKPPSAAQELGG